jgi:hypothetical protein
VLLVVVTASTLLALLVHLARLGSTATSSNAIPRGKRKTMVAKAESAKIGFGLRKGLPSAGRSSGEFSRKADGMGGSSWMKGGRLGPFCLWLSGKGKNKNKNDADGVPDWFGTASGDDFGSCSFLSFHGCG